MSQYSDQPASADDYFQKDAQDDGAPFPSPRGRAPLPQSRRERDTGTRAVVMVVAIAVVILISVLIVNFVGKRPRTPTSPTRVTEQTCNYLRSDSCYDQTHTDRP